MAIDVGGIFDAGANSLRGAIDNGVDSLRGAVDGLIGTAEDVVAGGAAAGGALVTQLSGLIQEVIGEAFAAMGISEGQLEDYLRSLTDPRQIESIEALMRAVADLIAAAHGAADKASTVRPPSGLGLADAMNAAAANRQAALDLGELVGTAFAALGKVADAMKTVFDAFPNDDLRAKALERCPMLSRWL